MPKKLVKRNKKHYKRESNADTGRRPPMVKKNTPAKNMADTELARLTGGKGR